MSKTLYLSLYNAVMLVLWSIFLLHTINVIMEQGTRTAHSSNTDHLLMLQSMAGLEIIHAVLGLVKSGVAQSALQWASRMFAIIVGMMRTDGGMQESKAFAIVAIAWSVADIIRYAFYLQPTWRVTRWLRYSAFLVLYPMGAAGEAFLVYRGRAGLESPWDMAVLAILCIVYPVGFGLLYTHMLKQRVRQLN